MSLKDKIAAELRPRVSDFDAWVAALPEDDRTALIEGAASGMSNRSLWDLVRAEGATVGRDRFTSWRKQHEPR